MTTKTSEVTVNPQWSSVTGQLSYLSQTGRFLRRTHSYAHTFEVMTHLYSSKFYSTALKFHRHTYTNKKQNNKYYK